jgi:hypothetical protein
LLGIGNADAGTTLPIDSLQFTSPRFLRVPGGSCPANLPFNVLGGASCTLAIAFQPIAFAASSGALTFSSTGSVAEFDPASVALDGIGIPEPPLFIDGFE